jgi:DNA-binding response OmpR family regulator
LEDGVMEEEGLELFHSLVVDDEQGVRFFISQALERDGHCVVTASSGEEALEYLRDTPFDLVILDLMLGSRIDGLRVLEAVKWRWPEMVVIILTAHGSLDSALTAIREGVDDYLLKPVEADDLRRAVQAALARRKRLAPRLIEEEQRIFARGPFFLDLEKRFVTYEGHALDLTTSEFELFAHLLQHSERTVSPVELVRVVRGYECQHLHEAREIVKWYVHRLRRKVEPDPLSPTYILTVRGVGYRFRE